MNYRHAFHAGNFADVVKHAALALVIESLKRKDTPFFVLDAHAGIGRYDLEGDTATRTGEAQGGIARVMAEPDPLAELAPYLEAVHALNPEGGFRHYPGSPRIARHLMRPQDRLALVELHPEDAALLEREFHRDRQVRIHNQDAYQSLKALLPPPEKRGLVLIDPPFEAKDEFDRALKGLGRALERWPTGIYMIWYPIKDPVPVGRFQEAVAALAGRKVLAADLWIRAAVDSKVLNGSGLIFINPPWQLDETLSALLPRLAAILAQDDGARASVEWLAGE